MSKINLLFPIAGKGDRFGGVFKPFLKIGDITFIEKTLESFGDLDQYDIFFICTKEQEETFDVQSFLENALLWLSIHDLNVNRFDYTVLLRRKFDKPWTEDRVFTLK